MSNVQLPNMDAIKLLDNLLKDAQYNSSVGQKVFNYQVTSTADYQSMCDFVKTCCQNIQKEAAEIEAMVPAINQNVA